MGNKVVRLYPAPDLAARNYIEEQAPRATSETPLAVQGTTIKPLLSFLIMNHQLGWGVGGHPSSLLHPLTPDAQATPHTTKKKERVY